MITYRWGGVGWGGVGWGAIITFMFLSRHRHSNLIILLAVLQTQALSFMISYLWGGVGSGGTITFMFLCTHRHSNLIIFLAVLQTQALLFHDHLPVGWGGVGWDKNVHVPVHTRAQQPHHLSCCPADTGTALS